MNKYILISIITVIFICSPKIFPQEIDPCIIFSEAREKCYNTNSIHYTIDSEGINKYKGHLDFQSNIIMQREDVKDIGFGKSVFKISATKKIGDRVESFSYSYDGDSFVFFNETSNDLITINNPEMANVLRVLGMEYGLVHSSEYFMDEPFQSFIEYKSHPNSRIDTIILEEIERVQNVECYKIMVQSMNRPTYWWIGKNDFMVHKLQTGIALKTINYLSINKHHNETLFSLMNTNRAVEKIITGEEADTIGLIEKGVLAPDFILKDLNNEAISLDDFRGKVVILDFWGTWCNPCKRVMPFYQELANNYQEKGLEVIGISVKSNYQDVLSFVSGMEFTYTFLIDGEKTAKEYGVELYPTLYILNREGIIIHAERGARKNQKVDIIRIIEKLLN